MERRLALNIKYLEYKLGVELFSNHTSVNNYYKHDIPTNLIKATNMVIFNNNSGHDLPMVKYDKCGKRIGPHDETALDTRSGKIVRYHTGCKP